MSPGVVSAVADFLAERVSGVVAAFVYGSVATGHARPGSDLDCFVLLDRPLGRESRESVREGFGRLQRRLGYAPDEEYPVELFTMGECRRALSSAVIHRALAEACSRTPLSTGLADADQTEVLRALLGSRLTIREAVELRDLTAQARLLVAEATGHHPAAPDPEVLRALGVRTSA